MSSKTQRPLDSAVVPTAKRLLPQKRQLLASAIGLLLLAPAAALELGEATMRSGLGEALVVEIPYRLAGDERLTPLCVDLAPAPRTDDALPTYSRVSRIAVTPTHIEIHGASRVFEPLIGLTVDVHCSTAPRFVRSYELFVDPPVHVPSSGTQLATARAAATVDPALPVAEPPRIPASALRSETASASTTNATASTAATSSPRANVSLRARGREGGTLTQGETYRVVRGDTLSGIAARVGNRPMTIRETAEAIFAANPEAFARGNRDLIEAGRSITIPLLSAAATVAPQEATLPQATGSSAAPAAALIEESAVESAPAAAAQTTSVQFEAVNAAQFPPTETAIVAETAIVTEANEPAPAVTALQQTSQAQASGSASREDARPAATGRSTLWLTVALALGVAIVVSTPFLFLRRRNRDEPTRDEVKVRSSGPRRSVAARRVVDPLAGYEVVHGTAAAARSPADYKPAPNRMAAPVSAPASAASREPTVHSLLATGPMSSVDLDVGAPAAMDERVDWFADRVEIVESTDLAASDDTIESATTARMAEPGSIDDARHTLTITELDLLREDYEAEHTLTQTGSKAMRDAVADLKATQEARAANSSTATVEMPEQPQAEAIDTQKTHKLRSSGR